MPFQPNRPARESQPAVESLERRIDLSGTGAPLAMVINTPLPHDANDAAGHRILIDDRVDVSPNPAPNGTAEKVSVHGTRGDGFQVLEDGNVVASLNLKGRSGTVQVGVPGNIQNFEVVQVRGNAQAPHSAQVTSVVPRGPVTHQTKTVVRLANDLGGGGQQLVGGKTAVNYEGIPNIPAGVQFEVDLKEGPNYEQIAIDPTAPYSLFVTDVEIVSGGVSYKGVIAADGNIVVKGTSHGGTLRVDVTGGAGVAGADVRNETSNVGAVRTIYRVGNVIHEDVY